MAPPRHASIHATRAAVNAPASTAGRAGLATRLPRPRRSLLFRFFVNMLEPISRNCAIKVPQVAVSFEKSDFFLLLRPEMLFIVARDHLAPFVAIPAPVAEPCAGRIREYGR